MLTKTRSILYFEALFFLLLGALAIALPQFVTIGLELLIGALFAAAGLVQGIKLIQGESNATFWATFFSSMINIVLGALLLFYPMVGVVSLTYLLIAYFILDGIAKLYYAYQLKPHTFWNWILVSGLLSLALAVFIFMGLPSSALWVLGLLVGINMLFFGATLLAFALKLPKE